MQMTEVTCRFAAPLVRFNPNIRMALCGILVVELFAQSRRTSETAGPHSN